ncbi:MAG: FkbM family methyltransferase, partial [Anderseniella sp.]
MLSPAQVSYNDATYQVHPADNYTEFKFWIEGKPPEHEAAEFLCNYFVGRAINMIDVGANAGLFSLPIANAAPPDSAFYLFEPNPILHDRIRQNVALNGTHGVELFGIALGDREQVAPLYLPGHANYGEARLEVAYRSGRQESIIVPVETLPSQINRIGIERIDLLKVDVEGVEDGVIVPLLRDGSAPMPELIYFEDAHQKLWHYDLLGEIEKAGYRLRARFGPNALFAKCADDGHPENPAPQSGSRKVVRIAIVICTHNQPGDTMETLASIGQLALPPASLCEVVIVNNSSELIDPREFQRHVKTLKTTVLHEPSPGLSVARNTAVAGTNADYVIFTDDDVTVPPDWLARYASAFRRYPDAAFFGADIVPDFPGADTSWGHALSTAAGSCFARFHVGPHDRHIGAASRAAHYPFGANMAFRADTLSNFRFDESLGRQPDGVVLSGEETGLIADMVAAGHAGALIADNPVTHLISPSRQTLDYVRRYYYGQGRLQASNTLKAGGWSTAPDRVLSPPAAYLFRLLRTVAGAMQAKTPAVWIERQ